MRLSLAVRAFAVVVGVWFAVALTQPAALHECIEHDVTHARDAQAHDAAARYHGTDGPAQSHHHACTCIGSCCAAPMTITPPAVAVVNVETTPPRPDVVRTTLAAYHHSAPEHARPPSQGPPLSVA